MAISKKVVGVGAGLAAVVAGAAAMYFLYGKNGSKNRKRVKGWMLQAKGEILEKMEQLKEVDEKVYAQLVAEVSKRYSALKKLDKKDVVEFAKEMQGYWRQIKKHVPAAKKVSAKKK